MKAREEHNGCSNQNVLRKYKDPSSEDTFYNQSDESIQPGLRVHAPRQVVEGGVIGEVGYQVPVKSHYTQYEVDSIQDTKSCDRNPGIYPIS